MVVTYIFLVRIPLPHLFSCTLQLAQEIYTKRAHVFVIALHTSPAAWALLRRWPVVMTHLTAGNTVGLVTRVASIRLRFFRVRVIFCDHVAHYSWQFPTIVKLHHDRGSLEGTCCCTRIPTVVTGLWNSTRLRICILCFGFNYLTCD